MNPSPRLNKSMSALGGTTFAISSVIGAGVFSLAGLAVQMGGPGVSVLSWLVTVAAISPFLFVFNFLSQQYGDQGSLIQYASEALGSWSKFSISFVMVGTYVLLIPVVALAGAGYVQMLMQWPPSSLPLIAAGLLVLSFLVNWGGTKFLQQLNSLSFLLLVAILGLLFVFNLPRVGLGLKAFLTLFSPAQNTFPNVGTLCKVSSVLLLALLGWENLSFGSAEIKNFRKVMPKIYLFSFFAVITVYLTLAMIVAGATLGTGASPSESGFLPLVRAIPGGSALIYATIVVLVANISSCVYAASRMLFSASQRGIFGDVLSTLNKRKIPVASLVYLLLFAAIVLFIQDYFHIGLDALVQMTNQNFMLIYVLCLVNFFRKEHRAHRWLILVPGLASTAFILAGFSWHFVFPVVLMLIGLGLTPARAYHECSGEQKLKESEKFLAAFSK